MFSYELRQASRERLDFDDAGQTLEVRESSRPGSFRQQLSSCVAAYVEERCGMTSRQVRSEITMMRAEYGKQQRRRAARMARGVTS